ncbi:MAG: thioredoxin domain-containing protein [Bdellovibrionales bacterium]|nr:thioredoxin domain-containing protein [Bdellovibrionales bacterium]
MKNIFGVRSVTLVSLGLLAACGPSPAQMTALLEKHPEILTNAIEKNPDTFMEAVQKAAQGAQQRMQAKAAKAEAEKFEAEFKNPLQPQIDPKRPVMGNSSAPITIVEYTDFQCPYCGRGYGTLEQVRKMYGDKVRVLVKNLPLPMHPMAMPAAKRFAALMQQSPDKAFAFYHAVFPNQQQLNEQGEKFLDAVAKKTGADLARMKKDMESEAVRSAIAADMAEAEKFGITGTPGFIVNGVSIRGAYPAETFKQIIDRKLAAK